MSKARRGRDGQTVPTVDVSVEAEEVRHAEREASKEEEGIGFFGDAAPRVPIAARVCVGPDFVVAERVKAVERAAKAELKAFPAVLRSRALAAAVLELARRLDNDPPDREAASLVRELRLALADLRRQAGVDDEEVIDVRTGALGT
jgi:hypothetical protein